MADDAMSTAAGRFTHGYAGHVTLDMVTLKMKTGTDGARFICYLRARLKRCALPCC